MTVPIERNLVGRLSDICQYCVKYQQFINYFKRGSRIFRIKPYFVLLLVLSMLGSSIMSTQGLTPTAETSPQTSSTEKIMKSINFIPSPSTGLKFHWGSKCEIENKSTFNCFDFDGNGPQQLGDGHFSRISSLVTVSPDSNSSSAPTPLPTSNLTSLPNGTTQYDKFGVIKIYPTKNAGEEWLMDMDNADVDKRFDPQEKITKNPDGSWKMKIETSPNGCVSIYWV